MYHKTLIDIATKFPVYQKELYQRHNFTSLHHLTIRSYSFLQILRPYRDVMKVGATPNTPAAGRSAPSTPLPAAPCQLHHAVASSLPPPKIAVQVLHWSLNDISNPVGNMGWAIGRYSCRITPSRLSHPAAAPLTASLNAAQTWRRHFHHSSRQ